MRRAVEEALAVGKLLLRFGGGRRVLALALARLGGCRLELVRAVRVLLLRLPMLADRLAQLPVPAIPTRPQGEEDDRDHHDRDHDDEDCAHVPEVPTTPTSANCAPDM